METKIKERRLALGFTQLEIVESVGITRQSYWRYESGQRVPDAMTAKRIAKVLETTVEKLF